MSSPGTGDHDLRRPDESFDSGLQHERTSLAWERTGIAMMVAGIIFARFAATDAHWGFALFGLLQTAFGGATLVWASVHYEDLHGPLRAGDPIVHPTAARTIGLATIATSALALVVAILTVI